MPTTNELLVGYFAPADTEPLLSLSHVNIAMNGVTNNIKSCMDTSNSGFSMIPSAAIPP